MNVEPAIPGMEVTETPAPTQPTGGGLLNKAWPYTPAAKTDIRKRFERMRQEQEAARAFAAKNTGDGW